MKLTVDIEMYVTNLLEIIHGLDAPNETAMIAVKAFNGTYSEDVRPNEIGNILNQKFLSSIKEMTARAVALGKLDQETADAYTQLGDILGNLSTENVNRARCKEKDNA